MKKITSYTICFIVSVLLFAANAFAQVIVTGYVRTIAGLPIKGATVKLVTLNRTATTNDSGFYDFANTDIQPFTDKADYSLSSKGRRIFLNLDHREKVSIMLFNLSGRLMSTVLDKILQPGNHSVELDASKNLSQQLYLAKIQVGSK